MQGLVSQAFTLSFRIFCQILQNDIASESALDFDLRKGSKRVHNEHSWTVNDKFSSNRNENAFGHGFRAANARDEECPTLKHDRLIHETAAALEGIRSSIT